MNNISLRLFHDFIEDDFNFKTEEKVNNFVEIVPFGIEDIKIIDILFDILKNEEIIPLYIVFESFIEDIQDYSDIFKENNIHFNLLCEQGMEQCYPNSPISPYFQLEINNINKLKKVLPLIYNIAAANLFVGIWPTQNFYFWIKSDWPIIKVNDFPFISFSPDAKGIYIFSTSAKWTNLQLIKKKLSKIFGSKFPEIIEWEYDGINFKEKD